MFWNRIANQNHFLDCICCAMVAIAARQGESSRLKIRKLSAAREVGNHVCTACATVTASSVSPVTFARTPMVETIASFAVKPDREAATGCHSPKPRGANRGAMKPPITASKLFPLSSTRPKPPFSKPNPPRNHITTQARNRIVPALMMKPFSLSHT